MELDHRALGSWILLGFSLLPLKRGGSPPGVCTALNSSAAVCVGDGIVSLKSRVALRIGPQVGSQLPEGSNMLHLAELRPGPEYKRVTLSSCTRAAWRFSCTGVAEVLQKLSNGCSYPSGWGLVEVYSCKSSPRRTLSNLIWAAY